MESRPVRGLLRGVRRSAEFCELGSEAVWDRNRGGAVWGWSSVRSGRRLWVWGQAGGVWRDLVQCEGVWGGVIGVRKELLGSAGGVWKGLEDSRPQHTPPAGSRTRPGGPAGGSGLGNLSEKWFGNFDVVGSGKKKKIIFRPFWAREAGRVWGALWTLGQSAGW